MAENKKSFILYCDLLATVSKLPDDVAGKLFKTILSYVNDENPEPEDILLQVAFEPIKQQLKRDLRDWEDEKKNRSNSGRIGGIKSAEAKRSKVKQTQAPLEIVKQNEAPLELASNFQAKPSTASKFQANQAVTDNVTVTVTDTVSVNGGVIKRHPTQAEVETYFLGVGGTKTQATKFYLHYKGKHGFDSIQDWLALAQKWYLEDLEKQQKTDKATW